MRKAIAGMVALAFLGMMFLTTSLPASATKPVLTSYVIAGGEITYMRCDTVNGKVTQCYLGYLYEFQGDWNGFVTYDCHSTDIRGQYLTLQCKGTFEGTILGRSGTVDTRFSELIRWDWTQIDLTKIIDVENIHSGTGGLEGIHGVQQQFTQDWNTGIWTAYWLVSFEK